MKRQKQPDKGRRTIPGLRPLVSVLNRSLNMKPFLPLLYLVSAIAALAQLDVSGIRPSTPASFQRDVRERLASRPELAAILVPLAIDDAGMVSGLHYYDSKLSEHGDTYVYQFSARPESRPGPSTLIVTVHFACPTDKSLPARISVSVADAKPQELDQIKLIAIPRSPNHPPS